MASSRVYPVNRSKAGFTYCIVPAASVKTIASYACSTTERRRFRSSSACTRSVMSRPTTMTFSGFPPASRMTFPWDSMKRMLPSFPRSL